ncbi:MAG: hypothetical protein ACE5G7_06800 [Candidatus Hydrothermarchaeaceae archaeon]
MRFMEVEEAEKYIKQRLSWVKEPYLESSGFLKNENTLADEVVKRFSVSLSEAYKLIEKVSGEQVKRAGFSCPICDDSLIKDRAAWRCKACGLVVAWGGR